MTRSPQPAAPPPARPPCFGQFFDRFEQSWQGQRPPRITEYLGALRRELPEAPAATCCDFLIELIKIDLEFRWRLSAGPEPAGNEKATTLHPLGRSPRLEDYFKHHPEWPRPDPLPLELVGEEYRVRHCWGDRPPHEEYAARFPEQGKELHHLLRRIDEELSAERRAQAVPLEVRRSAALVPLAAADRPGTRSEDTGAAAPVAVSCDVLLDGLAEMNLLTPTQVHVLKQAAPPFTDARALGKELFQRGWLTAFQVNAMMAGRGRDLFLGPYVLLERLGEGGTGQVFKARHSHLRRTVALKVIRKELTSDPEVVARFYREVEVISKLSHPNVVYAFDAGPIGSAHVLAMEYIEGTDLHRLVKERGALPISWACDLTRQAAAGLQHIHEHSLIHRDIKPSNLLISRGGGQVKILDLGLARLSLTVTKQWTLTLTPENGLMLGTPDYLAPEQALDSRQVDIRADIYSLGCTLWYMLTGQPPFPGGTLAQKCMKHQQAPLPDLHGLRPEVPAALTAVLQRMLAKAPEDRHATPGEVEAALAPFLGTLPAPSPAGGVRQAPQAGGILSESGTGIGGPPLSGQGKAAIGLGRAERAAPESATTSAEFRPRVRRWPWLVAALALMAGVAPTTLWLLSPGDPRNTEQAEHVPPSGRARTAPSSEPILTNPPPELIAMHQVAPAGVKPRLASVSNDGRAVAYLSPEGVFLWTRDNQKTRALGLEDVEKAETLTLSGNGRFLAVQTGENIRVWNLTQESKKPLLSTRGQQFALSAVQGGRMAAVTSDNVGHFFDLNVAQPETTAKLLQGPGTLIEAVALADDAKTLAYTTAAALATQLHVRALRQGAKSMVPLSSKPKVIGLAFASKPPLLAVASEDGVVRLLDSRSASNAKNSTEAATAILPKPIVTNLASLRLIALTADGEYLVAANATDHVQLWSVPQRKNLEQWRLPGQVVALTIHNDRLAVLVGSGALYLLRLPDAPPSKGS